ncbi:MerR family DNA-binding transcriptional regulator, partial [Patescibacteria group bacterium]|nr:MerR family DNA-binding transcriptional regulator [Patescibacteria group bacterium]
MKNLFTVREAAKFLGIATKTLRRWEEAGRLIPERTFGNHRR